MALSQKPGRREIAPRTEAPLSDGRTADLERRLAQLEKAPARFDQKLLEAIVGAIEKDLAERDEHWGTRMAGAIDAAVAAERKVQAETIDALRQALAAEGREREEQWRARTAGAIEMAVAAERKQQADTIEALRQALAAEGRERGEEWNQRMLGAIESGLAAVRSEVAETNSAMRTQHAEMLDALRRDVVADLRALESQGVAFQQEVTEAMPTIVEQQMAARLEERSAEMEQRLKEEVRLAGERANQLAAEALDSSIEGKLAELRRTLADRDCEIAELRQRLAAGDQRTLALLSSIGMAFSEAAGRLALPETPTGTNPVEEAPAPATEESPRFQVAAEHAWTLPLVSSLLVASGFLVCLHWL